MFFFKASQNLAIDLGNNTLITDQTSLLLSQPSCMVVNEFNNMVEAVGDKAYDMLEKAQRHLKPIKPMKGGVISDVESAKRMLKELVSKVNKPRWFNGRYNYLLSGIPFDTTSVEKRVLRYALEQFGLQQRIASNFQLTVTIDPHSLISVSKGISQVLAKPQKFQSVLF